MKRYLVLLLSSLLVGCGLYPRAPMDVSKFPAEQQPVKDFFVLLSGRGARASYFEDQRWVEIAREQGIQADFVAPYAHYGYYMTRTLLPRLQEDVMQPAAHKSYQRTSMAGISMGGLGLLLYSHQHPDAVDRLYLIAPYLGKSAVHEEIEQAGGLLKWSMKAENADDWNYFIWQHLKEIIQDPKHQHQIFLGYGAEDNLNGHELLAAALPKEHVIVIPGGHKDVIFTRIWEMMLEKKFL